MEIDFNAPLVNGMRVRIKSCWLGLQNSLSNITGEVIGIASSDCYIVLLDKSIFDERFGECRGIIVPKSVLEDERLY